MPWDLGPCRRRLHPGCSCAGGAGGPAGAHGQRQAGGEREEEGLLCEYSTSNSSEASAMPQGSQTCGA